MKTTHTHLHITHMGKNPSDHSMMVWDFIEVVKNTVFEIKKKNNKTKSNVGTSPYERIFWVLIKTSGISTEGISQSEQ